MTVGYIGSDGGRLYRREIYETYEEAWGEHEVIMEAILFDDHETIDNHEPDILITHPTENERLFLRHQFVQTVDPTKDLMFQRELPVEYEQCMRLIAEESDE